MGFDDIKNKAQEMMKGHPDQVNEGVDKAREFADEKTGGKYSDQMQKGADKLKQQFGGGGDQGGDQQQNPQQNQ